MTANSLDDLIKFWMQQRFATANRNDCRAERRQQVNSVKHLFSWNRLGRAIKFVAVSAREIAATYGNNLCFDWMVARFERLGNHARLAEPTLDGDDLLFQPVDLHRRLTRFKIPESLGRNLILFLLHGSELSPGDMVSCPDSTSNKETIGRWARGGDYMGLAAPQPKLRSVT